MMDRVEDRWQNSTPMPLASKTSKLCEGGCGRVAVRTTPNGIQCCQPCHDEDSQVSGGDTAPEPYQSVLEENADLVGTPAMDVGEDSLKTALTNNQSLLDGTQTRGSRRQQGSAEILDLFAHDPTTETQKEKARQKAQKEEPEE
jgi:hypothetical protein